MLILAQDLSTASLFAGEPVVAELQLQDPTGAVQSLTARAFVLVVYDDDRTVEMSVPGVNETDDSGDYVHFETDGQLSEDLLSSGKTSLNWEMSERQKNGRTVLATGKLTIKSSASADGVPSLGNGQLSAWMSRLTRREPPQSYVAPSFSQTTIAYAPDGVTPTPSPSPAFTSQPSVTGTPTVGQPASSLTYVDGQVSNGSITSRSILLAGTAIAATYVFASGDVDEVVTYRNVAVGNGKSATATSSGVAVTAAAPTPSPTPSAPMYLDVSPSSGLATQRNTVAYSPDDATTYNASVVRYPVVSGTTYLMTEAADTNSFIRSADMMDAAWQDTASGSGQPKGTTMSAPAGLTGPDGAQAYALNLAGSTSLTGVNQGVSLPQSTRVVSFYAKKPASGGANYLRVSGWTDGNPSTTGFAQKLALTTSWTKYEVVAAPNWQKDGPAETILIGATDAFFGYDSDCSGIVHICHPMITSGSSSYIPTTSAAATRPADAIALPLPTGTVQVRFELDDGTVQRVAASGSSLTIPTLRRPLIHRAYAAATAQTFTPYASNPIIPKGASGSWDEANVFDPIILPDPADASKTLMYASGQAAPVATGVASIGLFRGTVADPHTWTFDRVVLQTPASGWASGAALGLRLGSVLYVNSTFYMYFCTQNSNYQNSIGLATSTDGVNFAITGSVLLTPDGQGRVDGNSLGEPFVFLENGSWTMIYDYRTATDTLPGYRYATSTDGLTWTKGGSGDILSRPLPGLQMEKSFLTKRGGKYILLFEMGGSPADGTPYRIHMAQADAVSGPYQHLGPIITESGVVGAWDRYHVATPGFATIGGQDYIFYQGAGELAQPYYNNHWAMGVAAVAGFGPPLP